MHKLNMVRQWVHQFLHLVALTGAGVSAESGIPIFRETHTGYWAQLIPKPWHRKQGFVHTRSACGRGTATAAV